MPCPAQAELDRIFPPERADEFFDALYGDAEEGAYNIRLVCQRVTDRQARLAFELNRRPEKCLKCSLTYGLPHVFKRHPIINLEKVAAEAAAACGLAGDISWELGITEEIDDDKHIIPLVITLS